MTGLRPFSIRRKLIAIIAVITVAALLISFAFVLYQDSRTFERQAIESSVLFARVVGEYAVPELAFLDRDGAAASLAKLASVPDLRSAFLYDVEGELFASWGTEDAPAVDLLGAAVVVDRDAILVVEPVVYMSERFGTIVVRTSTAPLRARILRHLLTLFVALVVVVALALVAAVRLQRVISQPILDLAATMRRVSMTGDYSLRVEGDQQGEMAALSDGFNDMLDQIQQRGLERDQAELRTREKSRFLANMSHELRTPLNSIIGFSELLITRSESFDEKQKRFLDHILGSGRHLLALINDILDLAKVEAGHVELRPEPVHLPALVDGVVAVMKGVAGSRRIELLVDLPAELPTLHADPVKLKQILYNLLSNAVKFSPEGGKVEVRGWAVGADDSALGESSVHLQVIDQGIGISAKDQARIFAEFEQADEAVDRQFGGTGLGLTLVRAFAELHGGRVWVESAVGEGSAFHVLLPSRSQPAVTGLEAREPRATVLVVEDEPATSDMIVAVLQDAGFDTIPARTAEAALGLARSHRPAAITLDLVLPGRRDGWDVLKRLKTDPHTADLPIVIYSRIHSQELGAALGADDYFLKPVDLDRMVERLSELARPATAQQRVLLVDDDPQVHELLGGLLNARGYKVDHAYSRREAFDRAAQQSPSVMVLDLSMRGMEGFEMAEELRREAPTATVPMVLMARQELSEADRQALRSRPTASSQGSERLLRALRDLLARQESQERD